MKKLVLVVAALATVCVVTPAGAEPHQSATGVGVVTVRVTESASSYTWGPWRFDGVWRADDGSVFVGNVVGQPVTTAPPTPSTVITEFPIAGSNSTGAMNGTCTGLVVAPLPNGLEISMHCLLYIAGASLAADDTETIVVSAVHVEHTSNGDVTDYRGEF